MKAPGLFGGWMRRHEAEEPKPQPAAPPEPPPALPLEPEPPVEPEPAPEPPVDPLTRARTDFDLIRSVLGDDERKDFDPGHTVSLPLGMLLPLLPGAYVTRPAPTEPIPVSITIVDLFEQLGRGRVEVPVAHLVLEMPAGHVATMAYEDRHTLVELPLAAVVAAIDPAELVQRTAAATDRHAALELPDAFAKRRLPEEEEAGIDESAPAPDEAPRTVEADELAPAQPDTTLPAPDAEEELPVESASDVTAAEAETAALPTAPVDPHPWTPAATPPPLATMPAPQATQPEPNPSAEPAEAEKLERGAFGGVNLNTATRDQLRSLPGATPALVENIVAYRERMGGFRSVFDLWLVPRVGRKSFQKLTGMAYSEKRRHRGERLTRLLRLPLASVYHLPTIAERLMAEGGYSGCVLSDADGLTLVARGAADCADALSAIVPRVIQQFEASFERVSDGGLQSASVTVGTRMFTFVRSGTVYLSAVHERRKLTQQQLARIEAVAREVEWLLSHRAYVAVE